MRSILKTYLLVTGMLAVLAMAVPQLVIIGFFLLFIPGLFLSFAPTAFFYGALFAIAWFSLRARLGAWLAPLVGTVFVGIVVLGVPAAMNADVGSAVTDAERADREPAGRADLHGVLRIERSRSAIALESRRDSQTYACDDLCAAALFTPELTAVTVAALAEDDPATARPRSDLTATYRLATRAADAGCPDPRLPREGYGSDHWPELQAMRTAWTLALADGKCLVHDDISTPAPAADWTLRLEPEPASRRSRDWELGPQLRMRRFVLTDRAAEVARKTAVTSDVLQDVLWIELLGGLNDLRFGWGRQVRTVGTFDPIDLLKRTTTLGLDSTTTYAAASTRASVRAQLASALGNPAVPASAAAFSLIYPYLHGFMASGRKPDVRDGDAELLARLVADERVREFNGIYDAITALGSEAASLRGPMVARVLAWRTPADNNPARTLGDALRFLPEGLFATTTPDETRLLADNERRPLAVGLVSRQADRGAAAAPDLVRIIAAAYARPTPLNTFIAAGRPEDADAAVRALCLLGPSAAGVLPRLEALIESGALPRSVLDDRSGQLMLARLGKDVHSLVKPVNLTGSQEDFEARLQTNLAEFKPDYCR